MQFHLNRSDRKYLNLLRRSLEVKVLEQTAVRLKTPFIEDRISFERGICIDFFGYTATTLFDRGGAVAKRCVFDELSKLADKTHELNARGCLVRIRILLLYPYSLAGQVRTQAETAIQRASIEEPEFLRGFGLLEQLTRDTLQSSSLFSTLLTTARVLDEWQGALGTKHALRKHPNRIDVRFSCINTLLCGLRVNSAFFYDVYTYAKRKRHDRVCPVDASPLVELGHQDRNAYMAFCDHFRYLWEHDTTLDFGDVVRRDDDAGVRILPPEQLSFRGKSERLSQHRRARSAGQPRDEDSARQAYDARVRAIVRQYCPPLRPTPASEVAFLACSWRSTEGAPFAPTPDAEELHGLLVRHFGEKNSVFRGPRLGVRLLVGAPGKELAELLYGALQDATIGVVVLSPELKVSESADDDDERRWICRPNVYHELGYLMARLAKGRTFLFRERSVRVPANVGDLVHMDYSHGKIAIKYVELIRALHQEGVTTREEAQRLAWAHIDDLKEQVVHNRFSSAELKWAEGYVGNHLGGADAMRTGVTRRRR